MISRGSRLELGALSVSVILTFAIAACKKTTASTGGTVTTQFQSSRLAITPLAKASLALDDVIKPPKGLTATTATGLAVGEDIQSYSFRVSSIALCSHLKAVGPSASCSGAGEWNLYTDQDGATTDYNTYGPQQAASDTIHFTNVLDKKSLAALTRTTIATDKNVQTYDAVLVYWYRPFKVKADVTLTDGTKLYTKAAGSYRSNGADGLSVNYQYRVKDMTSGPAAESVFFLPDGGGYFRLQKPFELSTSDIESKTNFKVVLAFDPDGLIKGLPFVDHATADASLSGMVDAGEGYQIQAPFLQIAPIIARENETIMREVYLLRAEDGSHDVRLNLFYVKEDENKAIRAVTITVVPYNQTLAPSDYLSVDSVKLEADGSVDLKDVMGNSIISGLTRVTIPGEVAGTVAHVACVPSPNLAKASSCPLGTTTINYTYSLVAIGSISDSLQPAFSPSAPQP
ncbi:MAG: hypothetical protein H7249_04295 [Chitinophagaceae bacterium]|nr:hypothetical protein [Oligoflexus sp.]